MESIEKLREFAEIRLDGWAKLDALKCADEIEAEIERDYMKLPVDADGVPWSLDTESFIDDTGREVVFSGLQVDYQGRWKILSNCVWHDPSLCHHVKPDPLVELLKDFALDVARSVDENIVGFSPCSYTLDQYTERFRELMKEVKE